MVPYIRYKKNYISDFIQFAKKTLERMEIQSYSKSDNIDINQMML